MTKYILILFLIVTCPNAWASDTDSLMTRKDSIRADHPPRRAVLRSAIVPGLGQIYNRKYWKVPVVVAGLGSGIYLISYANFYYQENKSAYIAINALKSACMAQDDYKVGDCTQYEGTLTAYANEISTYQRYRELAVIGTTLFYVLNLVDASVDAHLFNFDVGDDLSLNIVPIMGFATHTNSTFAALTLKLSF